MRIEAGVVVAVVAGDGVGVGATEAGDSAGVGQVHPKSARTWFGTDEALLQPSPSELGPVPGPATICQDPLTYCANPY